MLTTKTVYSLYYPETRAVVDELWRERPHHLYERNYEQRQDAMHEPFLRRWREWATEAGVRLGTRFSAEYPIAGATEGIQALMLKIAASATAGRASVHVFDGEYEGFRFLAEAAGLQTHVHARDPQHYVQSIRTQCAPGDWFLLSQPSAIDGMVWHGYDEFVALLRRHAPATHLAVDLTYVGAVAREYAIDLTGDNIDVVLVSLSKPFGIYYHRVGALLSTTPFDGLFGNIWFKNLFSLELGLRLLNRFGPHELPTRHATVAARALQRAIDGGEIPQGAGPTDVGLLANLRLPTGTQPEERFRPFVRACEPAGSVLRFCLTPAMDAELRGAGARPPEAR